MATQAEINAFVEQIMPYFDPTPVEEDAVQESYPRLDRGLSDVQDMMRFQHLYGILDRGGRPFWLTDLDDATNTAKLTVSTTTGTAQSTIRGAFHTLREDLTVELPPVSQPTTQWLVDEYDPIRAEDGGDPIVSKMVSGDLDYSQGKDYVIHWEIPRRPSQLLTDVTPIAHRPRVAQRIVVAGEANLPRLPNPGILWGCVAYVHTTGEEWMARGTTAADDTAGRWENITSPEWTQSTSAAHVWAGHGERPAWRRRGDIIELKGRVEQASGNAYSPNNAGYTLIPNSPTFNNGPLLGGADSNSRTVRRNSVNADGRPTFIPVGSSASWIDLTGYFYYWK